MHEVNYRTVDENEAGQRLDNYLCRILKGVPKSHIYRIIRSGEVRINKKRAKAGSRIEAGDSIRIPPIRLSEEKPVFVGDKLEKKLLNSIIHEDNELLVMNKPAGLAVHGGSGLNLGLIEALRKTRDDLHYLELVHRLDKETSGCLLIAKKRSVLRAIHRELESRQVKKTYWLLAESRWEYPKKHRVKAALERKVGASGERVVKLSEEGKASETDFELMENFSSACWLKALPKTGRTHQIRVHAASLGHVIIGDEKYGYSSDSLKPIIEKNRQLYLHAREIQFNLNGKQYHFKADVDEAFQQSLQNLRVKDKDNND